MFYFILIFIICLEPPPPRVSDQCMNIQKNPWIHFLEHAWAKSCPQTGTDVQTDGQIDRETEKQTDRLKPIYPQNFV